MKTRNKTQCGFSLIELSIVLIIIGLLVAGITGGQSLIESARARALMNELQGLDQAVSTYFAAKGKLPGDPKNSGKISDRTDIPDYTQYGYPEDVSVGNVAFYDLDKEGIIDNFDIDKSDSAFYSKIIRDAWFEFINSDELAGGGAYNDFENKNILELHASYSGIPAKMVFNIDNKIDDGIYDSGSFRVSDEDLIVLAPDDSEKGEVSSYQDVIDDNIPAASFGYRITLN